MLCAGWNEKLIVGALLWLGMLLPIPLSAAQAQVTEPLPDSFEVASIKRSTPNGMPSIRVLPSGGFAVTQYPLKNLLEQAYDLQDSQVVGAPEWLASERYDINAATGEAAAAAMEKLKMDDRNQQLKLMLRTLFTERFKLAIHHESREMPVFVVLIAKGGPKLEETVFDANGKPRIPPREPAAKGQPHAGIEFMMVGGTVNQIADAVGHSAGRPVVDETGLKGKYNVTLKWNPRIAQNQMIEGADGKVAQPVDAGPDLFTALQEQLGLKLEARKRPVDVLVIDHIERPSEN